MAAFGRRGTWRGAAFVIAVLVSITASLAAQAAGVPNGGFETPPLQGDYAYNPSGAAWSFASSSGITGNDNAFTYNNPHAPEGVQVAFLQNRGAFAQVINLAAGTYTVSLRAAQRLNYQDGTQVVQVLVDGVEVGRFQPPNGNYTLYQTQPFNLGSGNHTLTLAGIGDGGDFTAFVDDVNVVAAGGPVVTTSSTRLASSSNPASVGSSVTFTATVTGSSPTGTVSFTSNGTTIPGCGASAVGGTGNQPTATCTTNTLSAGSHNIVASYSGNASNTASTSQTLVQTINSAPTATTTSLASSNNPSNLGSSVVFTAQVTGSFPTGTVNFTDGGATIPGCAGAPVTGSNNVRSAQCTTNNLGAGSHSIVANYSGDTVNAGSSSGPLTQTVNGPAPAGLPNGGFETPPLFGDYAYTPANASWVFGMSAGITGNGNAFTFSNPPAPEGVQVGFLQNHGTAMQTISLGAGAYVISVRAAQRLNFQDGIQTVQILMDGVEVGRYEPPDGNYTLYQTQPFAVSAGNHTLVLAGVGTGGSDFTAFVDDVRIIVSGSTVATTTGLASSNNPANVGAGVTFTATVTGANPSGGVLFTDNGNPIAGCGNNALGGSGNIRTATCTTSFATSGNHNIVATYGGNPTNAGSTSPTLVETINNGPASTTTGVTSSANPASAGASITFTATVSGNGPTGTVNFRDNGTTISGCGSRPLSGGSATCSTNSLAVGPHPITAVYSGDAANQGSTSPALTQTINGAPASTTTVLASNNNPSTQGSTVTFKATVSGASPTGTVAFFDGASVISGCASQPLTGSDNVRDATCSTSALGAGGHSIVAQYSGDAANAGSSSSPLTQTVSGSAPLGLQNRGFETPALLGDYAYNPTGASWTFNMGAGISGNYTPFTSGHPNAPEGVQVGFVQNFGSVSQTINLPAGSYKVSFQAAQRLNYQDGTQVVRVRVDGVPRGDFTPPPDGTYTLFETAPFALGAGNHTLSLAGNGGGGFDFTAFIDAVAITAVP